MCPGPKTFTDISIVLLGVTKDKSWSPRAVAMASFDGYVLIHHKRIKEKMKISKHEDQTCVENGLTGHHKDQKDEYTNHEKSEDKKRSIDLEQLISFEKMMPSKIRFSVDTVNQAFDLDYLREWSIRRVPDLLHD